MTQQQSNFIESMKQGLEGLDFASTGLCPGCAECMREHGYGDEKAFAADISSGALNEEPWFSWSPCVCCGSTLGGNREILHTVDQNNEIVHLGGACVNCVMYLANGDLPEDCDDN